ncbi:Stp1/IreP family PP2C-type Ser/Thr phosphatase [Serpentinicella sp. ANB-PHB4]|uniref:Stp1/IreP family PP2C-type Ser/Thr phosphatase n=1 Tax=Serpentinicella sp. ANB-PHB4 TaxID=3074076 RepID=UPI0028591EC3|nr:Stp1/IreP family PP2C-type Ser/Thr phosphatase [Serpentinicella sp. ANB-PHB4]MDR5658318.1 Stp1/IreP family PP2C-type Ser/Thr phosphatase [Serpentinicella sp. ANB-PHB4]
MKSVGCTDIGRVRSVNEDGFYIYEDKYGLYIVADGMGGHKSGDVASRIAIHTIKDQLISYLNSEELDENQISDLIIQAFEEANTAIYSKSLNEKNCNGMGTTATLILIFNDKAYIGHVGDSRAYVYRDKTTTQLTEDHSLVAELLKNGSINEREARRHPKKNIITRALGTDNNINVDIVTSKIHKNDIFILCTDGFSNQVNDDELSHVLEKQGLNKESCYQLVNIANEKGGYDNITLVLIGN